MCLNENSISESNLFFSKALTKAEAKQYSPLTLAFLGDAVYSLLVREMLLKQQTDLQIHFTRNQLSLSTQIVRQR